MLSSYRNTEWPAIIFIPSFFNLFPLPFICMTSLDAIIEWNFAFDKQTYWTNVLCVFVFRLSITGLLYFPFRVDKSCVNKINEHNFYVMNIEAQHIFLWHCVSLCILVEVDTELQRVEYNGKRLNRANYRSEIVSVLFIDGSKRNKNRKTSVWNIATW